MMNLRLTICFLMLVTLGAKGQTFSTGTISRQIPNNLSALYVPLPVSGLSPGIDDNFGLESVCLDITHTAAGNLEIYLIAPDGTEVPLSSKNGGTNDNYTGTCFKMNATTSVMRGVAPFTGDLKPEGDLGSVNDGENPNRNWGLVIIDIKADADSGVLNSWSLTFSGTPAKLLKLSSNLPIINIETHGQNIVDSPKKIVDFSIIYNGPGKRNDLQDGKYFDSKVGMEIRGSSSQQFPKKSYSLETQDIMGAKIDTSLLGMPSEHDWVLYAPFVDKTLMRNALTYKLYGEMGHYSVRYRFVEVVINRQYQGVYLLSEKVKRDKNRVDVAKLSQKDIAGKDLTGGYIFKIDRVNGTGGDGWFSNYKSGARPIFFQYEYPKYDSIMQVQKDYIKSYVDSFETALSGPDYTNPSKGYRQYIEVNSFIDNFILNEMSKNTDGYRLSTFLYKNKSSKDGRLCYGPVWDFDIAWYNTNSNGGNVATGWQYQAGNSDFEIPFWWGRLMNDTSFTNDLYCRYIQARKSCMNLNYLNTYIDSLAKELDEAQARNFIQWPLIGTRVFYEPDPIPADYQGEIANLKTWIKNRTQWLDGTISGKCVTRVETEDLVKKDFKLRVFPNPFMTSVFLRYQLHGPSEVNVYIYNIAGAMVKRVGMGERSAGDYHDSVNIGELPAGTYLLKLSFGNQVMGEKLIKSN